MIKVKINDVDIYDEYKIVLEDFVIGMPAPKIITVSIPGRDGDLDMSEALTGFVNYNDREIQLSFGITGTEEEIEVKRNKLMSLISGKKVRLEFSHLTGHFKGRCEVKAISREKLHYLVEAVVSAFPYRLDNEETIKTINLTSSRKNIEIINKQMPVKPIVEVSNNAEIKFKNKTFTLDTGTHILDSYLDDGVNIFKVKGSGNIKIKFRKGVI